MLEMGVMPVAVWLPGQQIKMISKTAFTKKAVNPVICPTKS